MAVIDFSDRGLKWETAEKGKMRVKKAIELLKNLDETESITEINLSGNILSLDVALLVAEKLKKHPTIKVVHLHDLFTGKDIGAINSSLSAIFDAIACSGSKITFLDVSDNALGRGGVDSLSRLLNSACLSELEILKINNNGFGHDGAKSLTKVLANWLELLKMDQLQCKLSVFECGRNRLEDQGLEYIASSLSNITSLKHIRFPQNGIRCPGIHHLVSVLTKNPSLLSLNLNDNLLLEDGAAELSKVLPLMTSLVELDVGDCLIRNEGLNAIVNSLSNCHNLKKMDLSFNELSSKSVLNCLKVLSTMPAFSFLNLNGNQLGSSGVAEAKSMKATSVQFEMSLTDDEGFESEDEAADEDLEGEKLIDELEKMHI